MAGDFRDADDFAESFPARAAAFYEIARWRLDEQLSWIKTLDNRLAAVFSLSAVIVALFAAAIALPRGEPASHVWVFAVVVLGFFAASTWCGYRAFSVRDWSIEPNLRRVQMRVRDSEGLQWFFSASEVVTAYYRNIEKIAVKERWTRYAIALTTLNAIFVSVAAIIATLPS